MQNNYKYALIYIIDGKLTVKAVSPNYAYIRRCKAVYDERLGAKGAIKKIQKEANSS